jgi:hypothetical protein
VLQEAGRVLEVTVRPEPRQLAPVRRQVTDALRGEQRSDNHIWLVSVAVSELLTLSMRQGARTPMTLRLMPSHDATRVEVIDDVRNAPAFDSTQGQVVVRVSSFWGVVREPAGHRTLWCDISRDM